MSGAADPIREFQDAAMRHGAYLARYERGLLRRIQKELAGLDSYVSEKIGAVLLRLGVTDIRQITRPTWSTERLKELLNNIRDMSQLSRDILNNNFQADLPSFAAYEAAWTAGQLQIVAAVDLDMTGLTPAQLYASTLSQPFLGVHLRDELSGMARLQQIAVKRAIRQGYLAGESIQNIIRRIKRDGVERTRADAERIVRTAITHTSNVANEKLYEQNADLVSGVRWVATLDGRTSPVCRARDGQTYPMGSGPRPPAHPNCRSRTVPILKTWAELGVKGFDSLDALVGERPAVTDKRRVSDIPVAERAGKIAQVPANTTYNAWLRTQPRAFINDVLGPTRADLYMRGGVNLDRFVDFSGKQYTLDQLRARDPAAFQAAGVV